MTPHPSTIPGLPRGTATFTLLALLGGCGGGDATSTVECVADSDCRTGACVDRACVAAASGGASAGAGSADEDRGGEGGEVPAPAGDAGEAGDAAVGSGGSGGGAASLGGSGGNELVATGGDPAPALGGAGEEAAGAGGGPPAGGTPSTGGSGATPGAGGTPTGGAPATGGSGADGGAGGAVVDVCVVGVENYCICQTEIGAGPCTPDLMVTMQMACREDETTSRGQPYRDILACHVENLDSGGQVSCTDAGICMLSVPSRETGGGGAGGAGGAGSVGPGGAGGAATGDCETCLASLCSAPINACALDPACAAMVECIGVCADDDCQAQCMVDNIAGLTLFEAVLNCSLDRCAVCG